MIDRIPPQAQSVEGSLIASILVTPDLIPQAIEYLEPRDFYNTMNQKIFSEITALYDDGQVPDIVLISESLKSEEGIDVHLSDIFELSTSTKIEGFINILKEKAIRRKIIEDSTLIQNQLYNEESKIGDAINQIELLNEHLETYSNKAGIKRRRRGRIIHIQDVKEEVENFWKEGKEKMGVPFNSWPILSNHYRLVKGTINVLNGIPTHGKTSFIDAIIIESIISKHWKWGIFSPENKPYYLHIQPLCEKYSGKPFFGEGALSGGELNDSLNKLNNYITFLEPDENNRTLKAIKRLILESLKENNIDAVVLDPWNKIEMELKTGESETQYIARSLLDLQYMARSNDIFIGIVAHPAKMYRAPKQTKYPVPTLYDLSGGANWYNGVDNGITIYRDFRDNFIEIHVQKIKFKNHGEIGTCYFKYNKYNGRFHEIKKSDLKKGDDSECFIIPEDVKPEHVQTDIWQDKF
ncbi:MAG: DnaB-like helicase N-terminal domain-containing protein [Candidatus Omnitrophota bacterium]